MSDEIRISRSGFLRSAEWLGTILRSPSPSSSSSPTMLTDLSDDDRTISVDRTITDATSHSGDDTEEETIVRPPASPSLPYRPGRGPQVSQFPAHPNGPDSVERSSLYVAENPDNLRNSIKPSQDEYTRAQQLSRAQNQQLLARTSLYQGEDFVYDAGSSSHVNTRRAETCFPCGHPAAVRFGCGHTLPMSCDGCSELPRSAAQILFEPWSCQSCEHDSDVNHVALSDAKFAWRTKCAAQSAEGLPATMTEQDCVVVFGLIYMSLCPGQTFSSGCPQ